ncbi:D-2-hydroxyacid dehydrogenase [Hydrocarboniclastica marina]|uniref:D-2-hydroxyacid dehydrogenase n=1 Tax=Hydrocarboniclastica marina TaxID=2259620 RepID=A0A4P7XEK3_9ALTE|nr:D-2-hydroxyacid dehydrogenase [Hydrocarboniclastica marina]MAL99693.1 hydroxyacid dehydrogenase [Alteromonadaceae bacterium]QCF25328.1 D-2-hydroxyacid dehydrogenase [Hydrocarboniclastica marina]|tara:strand:+ start:834 stop:1817 length:984 start_codon:yes stop_codon:yes gene_type:complete
MMEKAKPVVTVLGAPDEPQPPGIELLDGHVEVRSACDEASLRETLPGTQILLVTDFRTEALRAAWPSADSLQWVHATSAGVDALLIPELVDSDIPVTNAQGIFDKSIAEYVLGAILIFAKDFHGSLAYQRNHQWKHRDTERALGKRVLVVGAGSIGREIAKLTSAIGMEVYGVARRARRDDPDFKEVFASEYLHEQLGLADYVVLSMPLTPATEGMFGPEEFAAMKPEGRFINIARGAIVQTQALVEALEKGRIAGAALDVFEQEPLPAEHRLWDFDNVIMTAHMAGDFIGWRVALIEQFMANLAHWQKGEKLFNQVDKKLGYVVQG